MSRIKTYILTPNFHLTTTPSSPYHPFLGNIIADPLHPTMCILDKLAEAPRNAKSIQEAEASYTSSTSRSGKVSIWSTFLAVASAEVGAETGGGRSVKYTMSGGIETRYFEPTDSEVSARVQASARIQAAMNAGLWGRTPVYIVTGIKIARGFAYEESTSRNFGVNVGGSAPVEVSGEVSLGAKVDGKWGREERREGRMEEGVDVVFAYQVHVVGVKGWRERSKRVETGVWRSRHAFLGEGEEGEEEEGMEVGEATKEVMVELGLEEGRDMKVQEVDNKGEACVCILPNVNDSAALPVY
ncbi:MAG: hypothetical protein L6R37_008142 [Teloschistes peruensis]|nr:MAG: hypothetical protein L6R37_008142 [Teloschistes peruensis]